MNGTIQTILECYSCGKRGVCAERIDDGGGGLLRCHSCGETYSIDRSGQGLMSSATLFPSRTKPGSMLFLEYLDYQSKMRNFHKEACKVLMVPYNYDRHDSFMNSIEDARKLHRMIVARRWIIGSIIGSIVSAVVTFLICSYRS